MNTINKDAKIGVIGLGFVGQAVVSGYTTLGATNIATYDVLNTGNCNTMEELILKSEYIFVCVPTPKDNDKPDFSIVEYVCKDIDKKTSGKVIIIKSTVLPSAITEIQKSITNNCLAVNPEFLTQRTATADFLNPTRIIFGCDDQFILGKLIAALVTPFFSKDIPLYKLSNELAMKCKYASNVFGFMKITYFNIMKGWCQSQEEFETLKQSMLDSGWLAKMYTQVPGPDGKLGAGGACLPKEINAMVHEFSDNKVIQDVFASADNYNNVVRYGVSYE